MWLMKLGEGLRGGEKGTADSLHLKRPRPAQPLPPGAHDLAETYRVFKDGRNNTGKKSEGVRVDLSYLTCRGK